MNPVIENYQSLVRWVDGDPMTGEIGGVLNLYRFNEYAIITGMVYRDNCIADRRKLRQFYALLRSQGVKVLIAERTGSGRLPRGKRIEGPLFAGWTMVDIANFVGS